MEGNKETFGFDNLEEDTDNVSSEGFSLSFDDLAEDLDSEDIKDIKESTDVSHVVLDGSSETVPVTNGKIIDTSGSALFNLDDLEEDADSNVSLDSGLSFDFSFDDLEEDSDSSNDELFELSLDDTNVTDSSDINIEDYLPSGLLDSYVNPIDLDYADDYKDDLITEDSIARAVSINIDSLLSLKSYCDSTGAVVSPKRKSASSDGIETIMDRFYPGSYQLLSNLVDKMYSAGKSELKLEGIEVLKRLKHSLYTYNLVTDENFTSTENIKKITGKDNNPINLFDATEVVQLLQSEITGKKANISSFKFKVRHDKGLPYTKPMDKLYEIAQLSGLVEVIPGVSSDRPINERLRITGFTRDMVQPFTDLSLSDFISEGEYEILFNSVTSNIRRDIEVEQESLATKQVEASTIIKRERELAFSSSDYFTEVVDKYFIPIQDNEETTSEVRNYILDNFTIFRDINIDGGTFTCGSCGATGVAFTGGIYEIKKLLSSGSDEDIYGFSIPKLCSCGKHNILSSKAQNNLYSYGKRFLNNSTLNIGVDKIGGIALTLELPKSVINSCLGSVEIDDELAVDIDDTDKVISSEAVNRKEFFFNHLDALENYKNLKNYYRSYALDSTILTPGILDSSENFTGNVTLDNILSKKKRLVKLSKTEQLVIKYAKGESLTNSERESVDNYRTNNGDVLETNGDYLSKDLKQLAMFVCELTGTVYSEIKQQALDTLLTTLKDFKLDTRLNYIVYTQSLVYKSALPYLRGLDVSKPETVKILTFYTSRTNVAVLSSKLVDGCISKEYLNSVVDKVEVVVDNTISEYNEALNFLRSNYDRLTFIPIQGSTEIDMDLNGDILAKTEVKDLLYFVSDKMIVLEKSIDIFKLLDTKQLGYQALDLSKDFPSIFRRLSEDILSNKLEFTRGLINKIKLNVNRNSNNKNVSELLDNNSSAVIDSSNCKLYNLPISSRICTKLFTDVGDGEVSVGDITDKDIKLVAVNDSITSSMKYMFTKSSLRSLNISTSLLSEIKMVLRNFMDCNYINYNNSIVKLKTLLDREINSPNSSINSYNYLYKCISNDLDIIDIDTPASYVMRGLFEAVKNLDYSESIDRNPLNKLYYLLGGQFDKEEIYIYLDEISRKSVYVTTKLYKKLPGQTPLDYINNYKVVNRHHILSYFKDVILNSEDRQLAEKIIVDYFSNHGFLVSYFDVPLESSIPVKSLNDYLKSHYIPNTLLMTYRTNKFINKLYTEDYKSIIKMKILSDMSDFAIRHEDTIILSKVMFDLIYVIENFNNTSLIDFLKLDRFNMDRINNDVKDFSLNSNTLEAICDVLINIYYNDRTLDLNIILDSEFKRMSSSLKALALAFTREESDGDIRVLLDKSDILDIIGFEDSRVTEGVDRVFALLEEHEDDLKDFIMTL